MIEKNVYSTYLDGGAPLNSMPHPFSFDFGMDSVTNVSLVAKPFFVKKGSSYSSQKAMTSTIILKIPLSEDGMLWNRG